MVSCRRSVRLRGYNYASSGAYFVTVCAAGRKCLFGTIDGTAVRLTLCGNVVEESWRWLGERYPFIRLDEWIVMPNHLHAIIWLGSDCSKPLGSLIGAFKTVSSRGISALVGTRVQVWQRSYHEHIVRSDESLLALRQYINDNPAQWAQDCENPEVSRAHGDQRGTESWVGEWAAPEPPLLALPLRTPLPPMLNVRNGHSG